MNYGEREKARARSLEVPRYAGAKNHCATRDVTQTDGDRIPGQRYRKLPRTSGDRAAAASRPEIRRRRVIDR